MENKKPHNGSGKLCRESQLKGRTTEMARSKRAYTAPGFGKRLRLARIAAGFDKQADLANVIGVTPQTVQQWEAEETAPRGEARREQLAKLVKSSFEWLYWGEAIIEGGVIPGLPAVREPTIDYAAQRSEEAIHKAVVRRAPQLEGNFSRQVEVERGRPIYIDYLSPTVAIEIAWSLPYRRAPGPASVVGDHLFILAMLRQFDTRLHTGRRYLLLLGFDSEQAREESTQCIDRTRWEAALFDIDVEIFVGPEQGADHILTAEHLI